MNRAWGISADGSTAVGDGFPNNREAFRWNAAEGLLRMGDLPGGGQIESRAFAVSADGSIIVGYGVSDLGWEPFRWDATNGMQGLGVFGDFPGFNTARGVSADGSIVVGEAQTAFGLKAFIWDAANGLQELEVILADLGVDLTGWSLTSASGVSADGRTVVGKGINPSGVSEAWIAVLDDPAPVPVLGPIGFSILLGLVGAMTSWRVGGV